MNESQKIIKYCAIALAAAIILCIVTAMTYGISFISNFFDDNEEEPAKLVTTKVEGNITKLNIELNATDLTIKEGTKFSVDTNNKYVEINERGTELIVSERNRTTYSSVNNDVVITIPAESKFENVSIETGAGKIDLETITTETLDLDLGAGKTTIGKLDVSSSAEISGGVGKFEINDGIIKDLELDLGVGKSEVKAKLLEEAKIETGVGDLRLALVGTAEDYKIYVEKGLGAIKIDGRNVSTETTHGNGNNKINVDGGVGTIKIDFE